MERVQKLREKEKEKDLRTKPLGQTGQPLQQSVIRWATQLALSLSLSFSFFLSFFPSLLGNTWQGETDDSPQIKEQQALCSHISLPRLSRSLHPPQRIIDAVHSPEMECCCDFSPAFFLFFVSSVSLVSFFFLLPTPSIPGTLEASLLFPLPFRPD